MSRPGLELLEMSSSAVEGIIAARIVLSSDGVRELLPPHFLFLAFLFTFSFRLNPSISILLIPKKEENHCKRIFPYLF